MVPFWRKKAATALSLFLAVAICGCVVATKKTIIAPEITSLFEGSYTVDPAMEKQRPLTVAVLPFFDRSEGRQASETVRRGFYNHFSSLPFRDMELHRIDELLRQANLTDPDQIRQADPKKLGEILGVDAVVFGDISNFDKLFAVVYSQVSVGAEVKMVDARTGQFLWSGQHVVRIHEGGLSTTPVGLVAVVIATAMNMRDIQLLRACDDLFREMVKTIPAPTLAEALKPPAITLLVQDTKGLPKKAGDEIRVVMQGTPKMRASFAIGDFKKRVDMQEQEGNPGFYLGSYRIVPGDNVDGAVIAGRLADDGGNGSEWIDALSTVTIDTTPPPPPAGLRTVGRDKLVMLSWEKSGVADLAGYSLSRSATPLSGFQEIARTEFAEYRDPAAQNGVAQFYRVTALDRAGNESQPSQTVSGMAVAPGPTPVSGPIEADTTWYAGASPYVIDREVIVRDQAILLIEPGTEIQSRGPGLTVEGQIKAAGDGDRLIQFTAAEGVDRWEGIRFLNVKAKENVLKFVRVSRARTGIACDASSPLIEACELTANDRAIAVTGAFSAPAISANTIHKNEGAAVVVSAGARPVLSANRIQDNAGQGIVVDFAAPEIRQNTVAKNRGGGIEVKGAQAQVRENNLTDNGPFDVGGEASGEAVAAPDNWWGTARGLDIFARIRGRVDVRTVLGAPYPEGKPTELPVLESTLAGPIKKEAFLILSRSPYRVTQEVVIDGGAVLHIEPGVVLKYDRNAALVVEDGGIVARGTEAMPIVFTASGASPAPGAYGSAIRFAGKTRVNSVLSHCIAQYATTAFDVYYGTPEISSSHIADNGQGGVFARNDSAPQIAFCTFERNLGEGGIKAVGMSNPSIHNNNFMNNAVSVQGFSSIYIDARNNWWGGDPPDASQIWGDAEKGINIKPWLTAPEGKAFRKGP